MCNAAVIELIGYLRKVELIVQDEFLHLLYFVDNDKLL